MEMKNITSAKIPHVKRQRERQRLGCKLIMWSDSNRSRRQISWQFSDTTGVAVTLTSSSSHEKTQTCSALFALKRENTCLLLVSYQTLRNIVSGWEICCSVLNLIMNASTCQAFRHNEVLYVYLNTDFSDLLSGSGLYVWLSNACTAHPVIYHVTSPVSSLAQTFSIENKARGLS